MRRLAAIKLKPETFQAADKSQMEQHPRWLDTYEKREREETPPGLLLCADASYERVGLLVAGSAMAAGCGVIHCLVAVYLGSWFSHGTPWT